MEIFRKRKWLGLIILGILLRVALAGFVYHTDIKGQYHEAQLLDYGVAQGYQRGVDETTPLHYPPPIYLLYNIYPKVGNLIFSDYFVGKPLHGVLCIFGYAQNFLKRCLSRKHFANTIMNNVFKARFLRRLPYFIR